MSQKSTNRLFKATAVIVMTAFIVLLILRVCRVIDWSWWWVTSPVWLAIGVTLCILGASALIVLAFLNINNRHDL